jgi:hypothetical protein
MIGRLSRRLTTSPLVPWRLRHLGGPLNTLVQAPLRRRRLLRRVRALHDRPDDLTVVIGVKNRADHRLANALASLRAQEYPEALLRISVVDYDSGAEQRRALESMCARFAAACLRVEGRPVWNRAHCQNVGIRGATTKFLLSTDVDVLFAPSYVREAVQALRSEPLSVVYSQVLDLPAAAESELSREGAALDLESLRRQATPRSGGDCNAGVNATYTLFYRWLGGYDEAFEVWGSEDNDLARRFEYLGLRSVSLKERSFLLHQWHPKHQGVDAAGYEEVIRRNRRYYEREHSIVRNRAGWGETRGGRGPAPFGTG